MKRISGFFRGKRANNVRKKRLSPSAQSPEMMREKHPMYQYALKEYAQAIPPNKQNEDGRQPIEYHDVEQSQSRTPVAPSTLTHTRSARQQHIINTQSHDMTSPPLQQISHRSNASTPFQSFHDTVGSMVTPTALASQLSSQSRINPWQSFPITAEMPDAAYEEFYGEAYVGGPIKYIYPSGYKSMRPRSCPWKISIIICLLFTWLSIFIVGHCSDRFEQSQYMQAEMDGADDDYYAIRKQWCGSRPLYLMWVASMLITGVSAAYCSVIGYIQIRDFAVANGRSQLPGVPDVKSDYYVSIDQLSSQIYQSDGNPQFWGTHISRPTQAAVAITHR